MSSLLIYVATFKIPRLAPYLILNNCQDLYTHLTSTLAKATGVFTFKCTHKQTDYYCTRTARHTRLKTIAVQATYEVEAEEDSVFI